MAASSGARHSSPGTWRSDIDGLRAFAVLAVVFHHYFPGAVRGGFIGVDVFFVISGYLIGGVLLDAFAENRFSLLDFYARRARRILPGLLLVLGSCLLFGYFALLPEDYGNLGKHVAGGAGFVSNLVLFGETGYFDEAGAVKPLLHLWSLGIEEQFYLVFPLFIYLISLGTWRKQSRVALGIGLITLASFGWNLAVYRTNPAFDFYMPMTRFWELLAGVLLAFWQRQKQVAVSPVRAAQNEARRRYWADKTHWMAGIGFLLLILSLNAQERRFPGIQALVPVFGTVLLIAAGTKVGNTTIFNRLLSRRPLVWIGLISYPLYLWHWPLLVFPRIILGEVPTIGFRWVLLLLALILATLTYKLVEQPLRFGKFLSTKAIGLTVALALFGLFGYGIHLSTPGKSVPQETGRHRLVDRSTAENTDEACRLRYGELYDDLLANPDFSGSTGKVLPYCRYQNAQGTRTAVLWGDSHALAAYEAVADYNARLGINTWLVGRSAFRHGIPAKALPGVIDRIALEIQKNPEAHTVFLIMSAEKMDSERVRGVLQPIIDRMNQLGKQIYVLADNPELTFDARMLELGQPLRVVLHRMQGTSASQRLLKDQVRTQQKNYLNALNQLHGATIIPSIDAFCPSDECLLFNEEGASLYRDEDHLSRYSGGRFLVGKVLKPYLDAMAR
ncbi:acyltransferase family protein [Hylemonella gracilis]|uniref:Acyltransferase 3 n=1 Tax=Hylemonella gracilis ATCC 19624 TaxID=887062 RepID=F3KS21_9BURK|nr:acyltransferase family protein [Hylemonella gracilis]EGI77381.1 acyltransferase 3 [Hylemonella gracilis ATCC 19624]